MGHRVSPEKLIQTARTTCTHSVHTPYTDWSLAAPTIRQPFAVARRDPCGGRHEAGRICGRHRAVASRLFGNPIFDHLAASL